MKEEQNVVIGDKDIEDEIEKLDKMPMDQFNANEIVDRYQMMINHLDGVIREKFYNHKVLIDKVNEVLNSNEVINIEEKDRDELWYGEVFKPFYNAYEIFVSGNRYINSVIKIYSMLVRKLTEVLSKLRNVSEEKIKGEIQKGMMDDWMQKVSESNKTMIETMLKSQEKSAEAFERIMDRSFSAITKMSEGKMYVPERVRGSGTQQNLTAALPEVVEIPLTEEENEIQDAVLEYLKRHRKGHINTVVKVVSENMVKDGKDIRDVIKKMRENRHSGVAFSGTGLDITLQKKD